jgi:hypothetical protein
LGLAERVPSFSLWQRFQQYFLYYRGSRRRVSCAAASGKQYSRIQMTPGEATVDDKFSLEK